MLQNIIIMQINSDLQIQTIMEYGKYTIPLNLNKETLVYEFHRW